MTGGLLAEGKHSFGSEDQRAFKEEPIKTGEFGSTPEKPSRLRLSARPTVLLSSPEETMDNCPPAHRRGDQLGEPPSSSCWPLSCCQESDPSGPK